MTSTTGDHRNISMNGDIATAEIPEITSTEIPSRRRRNGIATRTKGPTEPASSTSEKSQSGGWDRFAVAVKACHRREGRARIAHARCQRDWPALWVVSTVDSA
jgi:hypothetical protein